MSTIDPGPARDGAMMPWMLEVAKDMRQCGMALIPDGFDEHYIAAFIARRAPAQPALPGAGFIRVANDCPACDGSGIITQGDVDGPCATCKGTGDQALPGAGQGGIREAAEAIDAAGGLAHEHGADGRTESGDCEQCVRSVEQITAILAPHWPSPAPAPGVRDADVLLGRAVALLRRTDCIGMPQLDRDINAFLADFNASPAVRAQDDGREAKCASCDDPATQLAYIAPACDAHVRILVGIELRRRRKLAREDALRDLLEDCRNDLWNMAVAAATHERAANGETGLGSDAVVSEDSLEADRICARYDAALRRLADGGEGTNV